MLSYWSLSNVIFRLKWAKIQITIQTLRSIVKDYAKKSLLDTTREIQKILQYFKQIKTINTEKSCKYRMKQFYI